MNTKNTIDKLFEVKPSGDRGVSGYIHRAVAYSGDLIMDKISDAISSIREDLEIEMPENIMDADEDTQAEWYQSVDRCIRDLIRKKI